MATRLARFAAGRAGLDYGRILRAHRMTWRTNGYGYDVTCSCGWDSRTGYAIRERIREAIDEHRLEAVWALAPGAGAEVSA